MSWLKVEAITPDKPELLYVARVCGCTQEKAFFAWFRLWVWFDGTTADGVLPLVDPGDCDARSGLPGMARALETAGWLRFTEAGCEVLNWKKHNGASTKARALTARRVAMSRAGGGGQAEGEE